MSTTRIQLKRADNMSSLNAVTLAKGEPAVYFDSSSSSGVLYIGDGVTSPGLEFATSGSSITQHLIANTTTIGPSHSILATHLGSVLTAIDSDDAKMQRLGFYDLGPASPISSGLNSLGISDILYSGSDSTGIRSRWHWMNTHVAVRRSIFYTGTSYSNVGNGYGSGVGNMEHSSTAGSDTGIAYQVQSLSYDYEAVGSSDALSGTDGGVMALVARKSGGNNVLEFKRLGSEDLTGDLTTHAITSVSHTGTASSVYHTPAASTSIVALSYAAAANGSVLKKSSSGILHFAKLGYADITGIFHIPGDYAGQEAFTLRYDGTGVNGWEACNFVRSIINTTYAQSNISNAALDGRTPSLVVKDYDPDYLSSLEIMILKGTQADLNSYAANKIVFSAGKDASTTNRDMLFYTRLSRQSDVAPNFWMRADGSFWINSSDDTRGGANFPSDITTINRALYVYPKKMGRISGSVSNYPGWAGLEIGDLTHTQSIASTPSSSGLNGIKIGNITSVTAGSANSISHHNLYFLNCENLITPASSYGIKMGSILAGVKENSVARGLDIDSVITLANNGNAVGIRFGEISGEDFAHGSRYMSIISTQEAVGNQFESIRGASSTVIYVPEISSTARTRAFNLTSVTSDISATGIYMPNLLGTTRTTGLFIGINNTTITDNSLTGNHAIYTVGGKHVFGGNVDITGNLNLVGTSTFDGNITVADGRLLTVNGSSNTTSVSISNGNLEIPNGYFSGVVRGIMTQKAISITTQTSNSTNTLFTESEIQRLRYIRFTVASITNINPQIFRLGRGYDGQIITITLKYNGNPATHVILTKDPGDNSVNSDLEFKDGGFDLFDHWVDLYFEEAVSFICEYVGLGHHNTDWQTGQIYKWKLIQNM